MTGFFTASQTGPGDYDLILTGDLGLFGRRALIELCGRRGIDLGEHYRDGGLMLFDTTDKDIGAGGSGCGCSAAVLTGYVVPEMINGRWRRVLFAGTGALHSPVSAGQGLGVPGICHIVTLTS
jgi:stage V sporulation protein AD